MRHRHIGVLVDVYERSRTTETKGILIMIYMCMRYMFGNRISGRGFLICRYVQFDWLLVYELRFRFFDLTI